MKVLDGGTATEICRQGFDIEVRAIRCGQPEFYTLNQLFLKMFTKEAGSELVVTASYQASVDGFKKHLGVSEDEALSLLKKSVHLAKEARSEAGKGPSEVLVAASVGPYGAILCDGSEYSGQYVDKLSIEELRDWHRPRMAALIEAGADILAIETIPAQKEATAILLALADFPSTRAYVTFSCKDGEHTCYGDKFSLAVSSVCSNSQVIAVGLNCTPPQYVTSLLRQIPDVQKDIIVKPNSGEIWEEAHWKGKRDSEFPLIEYIPDWLSSGATWIGGCCRIFPYDIVSLKKCLSEYSAG
ncbi:hypothetical protein FSP39_024012 [Pinctada imbricata]|uniref:Hcy-binding domain-containing protein n=1 Tax=Pinctada imbricata TaxID=66713 RepID=A0AA88YG78_PINIB|nr:hypothetical protein FSP39_024012 [Pinctada imbricata]